MLPPYTKQIHYPPTPLWYCGTSRVSWQVSRQQNMCQTSLGFSMLSRIEKVKDIPMRFSFFSNLWSFWEVGWICKKVLQKSQEFAGLNSTKKDLYVAPSKKKGSFATYFGQIKGGEPTRQLLYDDFNDKNLIFYEGPQTTFKEAKKKPFGAPLILSQNDHPTQKSKAPRSSRRLECDDDDKTIGLSNPQRQKLYF